MGEVKIPPYIIPGQVFRRGDDVSAYYWVVLRPYSKLVFGNELIQNVRIWSGTQHAVICFNKEFGFELCDDLHIGHDSDLHLIGRIGITAGSDGGILFRQYGSNEHFIPMITAGGAVPLDKELAKWVKHFAQEMNA